MDQKKIQPVQVIQSRWAKLIPKKYCIKCESFKLSKQQIKFLISSESNQGNHEQQMHDANTNKNDKFLTPQQTELIKQLIEQSPEKSVFIKLNNRTPKDLNPFLQKIHNIQDLYTVLRTSEYIIEDIQQIKGDEEYILQIRHYDNEIQNHLHQYEIYVRGGVTIAIVQRFMDHIGKLPSQEQIGIILQAIQTIMPGVTISIPKSNPQQQPNCFVVKLFIKGNKLKILGIHKFPDNNNSTFSLIKLQQIYNFYENSVLPLLKQPSAQEPNQIYQTNQNIKPLIKVLTDESMLKKYDMGEYQMGNQIANEQMLSEWKQFIHEAEKQIKK